MEEIVNSVEEIVNSVEEIVNLAGKVGSLVEIGSLVVETLAVVRRRATYKDHPGRTIVWVGEMKIKDWKNGQRNGGKGFGKGQGKGQAWASKGSFLMQNFLVCYNQILLLSLSCYSLSYFRNLN